MGRLSQKEHLRIITEALSRAEKGDYSSSIPSRGTQDPMDSLAKIADALIKSEARHRNIVEHANEMVVVVQDGRLKYCNPKAYKDSGYTLEELLSKPFLEFIHPDDHLDIIDRYVRRMSGERLDETFTFRLISRNKGTRWVEVRAMLIEWEGKPAILDLMTDITERRNAEDALKESEARYRLLAENANDIIFTVDLDLRFTFISPSVERIRGYTVQEAMAQSLDETLSPASLDLALRILGEEMEIEESEIKDYWRTRTMELELKCRGGTTILTETTFTPFRNNRNTAVGFMGIARDITSRKQAENELRESESRFRTFMENFPSLVLIKDHELRPKYFNKAFRDLFKADAWLGKTPHELFPHDVAELMVANDRTALEKGFIQYEETWQDKEGHEHVFETRKFRIDRGEAPPLLAAIIQDITDSKRSEELIRKSERLYRTIFENTGNASILIGEDTTVLLANSNFEKLTGYTKEEMEGKMSWTALIHQEDLEMMRRYHARRRMEGGSAPNVYEFRLKKRSGELRDIFLTVAMIPGTKESIASCMDITERKRSEEERLRSEKKYREILEEIDDGYYEVDLNGSFTFFNNAMCRILRYAPEEMEGMNNRSFTDTVNAKKVFTTFNQVYTTGRSTKAFDWELTRKDGTRCLVETSVSLMRDDRGTPIGFRGISRDVTGQKNLQQQLIQAQKMESIGRMTGGIAHDFNNMLTPILGYAELLMNQLTADDPRRMNVENIIHSAERSRDLVRQLLAFSRKQNLEMKHLDINSAIASFEKILRRTLHENVEIRTRLEPAIGSVLADVGQIEQIIMNLAVNAQDAMPGGGILFIETSQVYLDDGYVSVHKGSTTGMHVMLTVSDNGTGMDSEKLSHVFEPFYTTKAPGKGTGLGLATVYGIIKQHGGYIMAYSEPGKGATFRIYFPCSGPSNIKPSDKREYQATLSGTETVMVVEDETLVRDLITDMLKTSGYTVIEASDGRTALELSETFTSEIHILITDIVLPDMNGTELYEALKPNRPEMKTLFMSGYTPDVVVNARLLDSKVNFIEKPFSLLDFSRMVRKVLDQQA